MLLRQQQDLENLRNGLMSQLAKLEEREKKLQTDRDAFAAERKKIAATEGDKQFQLALATLEGQKPADAKKVLRAMLDAPTHQTDQVVSYLAKMDEGKRAKIMAEFVKEDPAVAAELLERLRIRGLGGAAAASQDAASQGSGHDATRNSGGNGGGSGVRDQRAEGAGPGPSR